MIAKKKGVMKNMRSLREYKSPKAEVTVFECEDIITRSLANSLNERDELAHSAKSYVRIESGASWGEIYGGN